MTLFYDDEVAAARQLADVVDLFAGPGGWDEAAAALGLSAIGLEFERWACATRRAAGHPTVECDVSHVDPADFIGARGLIGSPPCQALSNAGLRAGIAHVSGLVDAIRARQWDHRPSRDPRVWLALEVGRWFDVLRPEWIALEQVPAALPLWEAFADVFSADGYSVWTGILNAADYGVPQIRRRAVLIASRVREVAAPPPTHAKDPTGELAPWIPVVAVLPHFAGLVLNTGRDWKPGGAREDAQTVELTNAAPVLTFKSGSQWIFTRPATTIAGDGRMFAPGGHIANDGRDNSKMIGRSDNTIKLEPADALVLQSFRPDYPVRGTKSRAFKQIGNAIPPLLARAILSAVL